MKLSRRIGKGLMAAGAAFPQSWDAFKSAQLARDQYESRYGEGGLEERQLKLQQDELAQQSALISAQITKFLAEGKLAAARALQEQQLNLIYGVVTGSSGGGESDSQREAWLSAYDSGDEAMFGRPVQRRTITPETAHMGDSQVTQDGTSQLESYPLTYSTGGGRRGTIIGGGTRGAPSRSATQILREDFDRPLPHDETRQQQRPHPMVPVIAPGQTEPIGFTPQAPMPHATNMTSRGPREVTPPTLQGRGISEMPRFRSGTTEDLPEERSPVDRLVDATGVQDRQALLRWMLKISPGERFNPELDPELFQRRREQDHDIAMFEHEQRNQANLDMGVAGEVKVTYTNPMTGISTESTYSQKQFNELYPNGFHSQVPFSSERQRSLADINVALLQLNDIANLSSAMQRRWQGLEPGATLQGRLGNMWNQAKMMDPTGLYEGGILEDDEYQRLSGLIYTTNNALMAAISGAAVSPSEELRLTRQMPTMNDKMPVFLAKLFVTLQNAQDIREMIQIGHASGKELSYEDFYNDYIVANGASRIRTAADMDAYINDLDEQMESGSIGNPSVTIGIPRTNQTSTGTRSIELTDKDADRYLRN